MRKYAWLILSMGLFTGLVGCGEDDNGGGGGTAGSGGTGGAGTATVSGIVYAADDGEGTPLQGATVSVVGGASTTSGVGGVFSLQAPLGTVMFLTTAPNAWGELFTADVPAGGENMAEPEVLPDALVAGIAAELSETIDPMKGLVVVEFDSQVAEGGETANLTANYEFSLVFDAAGNPARGNALVPGADPIVIFANVDITANVAPSATGPNSEPCPLEFPTTAFPSQAKVFTVVDVATCP
ncbi:MAG: hypothetical protein WCB63_06835 [Polyangiales bacterium]